MTTKTFDAVQWMRTKRNKLSQEMAAMNPEERIQYIRERAASTALGRELLEAENVARPRNAADGATRRS